MFNINTMHGCRVVCQRTRVALVIAGGGVGVIQCSQQGG